MMSKVIAESRSSLRRSIFLIVTLASLCCLLSLIACTLAYLQYKSYKSREETLRLQEELALPIEEILSGLESSGFAKDVNLVFSAESSYYHAAVFAFTAPHTWHKDEYDQSQLLKRWAESKGWKPSLEIGSSAGIKRLRLCKGLAKVHCLLTICEDMSLPANIYDLDPDYMAYERMNPGHQHILGPELGDRTPFRLIIQIVGRSSGD